MTTKYEYQHINFASNMCYFSFFVIAGIFLSVVHQSSSVPFSASADKLCVGNNGYMTIVEGNNILSILKNEDYHDKILIDLGNNSYVIIDEDNPHGTIPINFTTIGSNRVKDKREGCFVKVLGIETRIFWGCKGKKIMYYHFNFYHS